MPDSNLRPPAGKAGFSAIENVPSTCVNQLLTPNNRSHGRSRGAPQKPRKTRGLVSARGTSTAHASEQVEQRPLLSSGVDSMHPEWPLSSLRRSTGENLTACCGLVAGHDVREAGL